MTKVGERGPNQTGGISNQFNKKPEVRARRKASEARRVEHRQARAAWSNDSKATPQDLLKLSKHGKVEDKK